MLITLVHACMCLPQSHARVQPLRCCSRFRCRRCVVTPAAAADDDVLCACIVLVSSLRLAATVAFGVAACARAFGFPVALLAHCRGVCLPLILLASPRLQLLCTHCFVCLVLFIPPRLLSSPKKQLHGPCHPHLSTAACVDPSRRSQKARSQGQWGYNTQGGTDTDTV